MGREGIPKGECSTINYVQLSSTSANVRDKIWNEPSPSSPDAARSILLVLGKEAKDLLLNPCRC